MAYTSEPFRLFSAARAQSQRARQVSKIEELVEALKSAEFLTLDEQAKALGPLPKDCWWRRRHTNVLTLLPKLSDVAQSGEHRSAPKAESWPVQKFALEVPSVV